MTTDQQTLDAIMAGKGRGSVRVRGKAWRDGQFFAPFFKDRADNWCGHDQESMPRTFGAGNAIWLVIPKTRTARYFGLLVEIDKSGCVELDTLAFENEATARKYCGETNRRFVALTDQPLATLEVEE